MKAWLILLLLALYSAQVGDEGMTGLGFGDVGPAGGLVDTVVPGSPAARAGLKPGDVVLSVGETSLRNVSFAQAMAACRRPVGTSALLELQGKAPLSLTWEAIPAARLEDEKKWLAGQRKVDAYLEVADNGSVGLMLEAPVGHLLRGNEVVLVPGTGPQPRRGRLTRIVSHFRVEADLGPGADLPLWTRVAVVKN